jgi:serine/threonine protein kinase
VATTPAKRACPECGTLLPEEAEFCPVCALREAVKTQTESLSDSSVCELRFEHYTVLRNPEGKPFELGRGGMGVTYKAIDTHLRCPVALKIINAQFIGNESAGSRFLREARAAASVHHPNVATVHHLGESSGNYFYVMEFVDGETLEALIHRRGRLEIDLALEIVTQVAAGLAAIHKQHLVHRDIKPSNIMLSWEEGRLENVKIIDLGLAKGVTEDTLSIAGSFIGTPVYASPEQFAGLGTDIRSDLYSLGVTLWEMLSGKPPFQGSVAGLMDQHQHALPPFEKLRDIPGPIIALLQVLLAKDPGQRFQNPAQLPQSLTKVREAIGSGSHLTADELRSASPAVTTNVSKRKPRKQTVGWVLGVGLCLVGGLIAWFFFSGYAGFLSNRQVVQATPTEKSVAVLPFESLSESKSDAYFADGVQDEILNNLAKIAQLKVISRTSVMQYRADTKRDLRQIATTLGVANVLEGTVRRDGNHVRVSTELVDARNDSTIWADSYDRDLTDIFAIQNEVAQKVASRLRAQLSPEEKKGIEEKPTENLEAYELYLQANQLLREAEVYSGQRDDFIKPLTLLREATRKDPAFALAYCSIAQAYGDLYIFGFDRTSENRALGRTAVDEALRLRPNLPEAHLAIALHLIIGDENYERAQQEIAIAERASPNNPYVFWFRASIDSRQGRWEESAKNLERAAVLEPRYPKLLIDLESSYLALRRFRQAEQVHDRLIELRPDDPGLRISKTYQFAFREKADLNNYLAAFELVPSSSEDRVDIVSSRIQAAIFARDWTKAKEILSNSHNEEFVSMDYTQSNIPRGCLEIWIAGLQEGIPATRPGFEAARNQLNRKIDKSSEDPNLLSALGTIDAVLGSKQVAIQEAKRATEMFPISKDAEIGPGLVTNLAIVYAWTNEPELAFQELRVSVETANGILYGELKLDPAWDPLRKDPRFDKLLAELAPHD